MLKATGARCPVSSSNLSQEMSALPPKADIGTQSRDVRFVPKADMPLLSLSHPRTRPRTALANAS
jgi:hypothetical protein